MRPKRNIQLLALDLEGTLISNAMSQIPRPGLRKFLDFCGGLFPRLVIYTFVAPDRFRQIARVLVNDGSAPGWFDTLDCIEWDGKIKDLRQIPDADPARTLLVDDYEPYIHPQQRRQWIAIRPFAHPYLEDDRELPRVRTVLESMLPITRGSLAYGAVGVPGARQQASAIPFRFGDAGVEVLLVTSLKSGRWILPKGHVEPWNTPAQAAANEACEEAGVAGSVSPVPVATYEYEKASILLSVQVFPLRVGRVFEVWPESAMRRRRWAPLDDAMRLVEQTRNESVLQQFAEFLQ